ncbi:MAG: hypothetical protein ABI193_18835 [Minicystis sp.]
MSPSRAALIAALASLLACSASRPSEDLPSLPLPAPLPALPSPVAPAVDFAALSAGPASHLLGVERADVRSAPGAAPQALAFAVAVERILDDRALRPSASDAQALLVESLGYLDAALARTPRGPIELQLATRRASLRARSDHAEEAFETLQRLLADHPNLLTLDVLFRVAAGLGKPLDVSAECQRVRAELRREVEIFALYDRCLREAHATTPEAVLPWATREESARYRKDRAEREAREARVHERFNEELIEEPLPDAGTLR